MKKILVFGFLAVLLLVMMPLASAQSLPTRSGQGGATESKPFTYIDMKVNKGDVYKIYVSDTFVSRNLSWATLWIEVYDKNGKQTLGAFWTDKVGGSITFNNNKGPTLKILRVYPKRCLPRTNNCSEDTILISIV